MMMKVLLHGVIAVLLTLLTQIGGLAWLAALAFPRKILAFILIYAGLALGAVWVAPQFGRVALSCFDDGPLQVQNPVYCAMNRTYVTPDLRQVLTDAARQLDADFPGTATLVLDASFPFFDGFTLLPHLSHDDGEKVDLAFYYRDDTDYLPGATRSPIGYFAFEPGPTECVAAWPTLRWNFDGLQPLWKTYSLDTVRNAALLRVLANDARVGRIFIEPHLARSLGVAHPKIRFQGCGAARHDDHIHIDLK